MVSQNNTATEIPVSSSESEQAREHLQKIRELTNSMQQAKLSMIRICAESIDVAHEKDVNRLIWHGIVQFANCDITNPDGICKAFLAFQSFSTLCLNRMGEPLEMTGIRDLPFHDLESIAAKTAIATFEEFFDLCCNRLQVLHSPFRRTLQWLINPNNSSRSERDQAIKFLIQHGGDGAIEFGFVSNDNFDDSGNEGAPYFYWKHGRGFKTILSPVANFILDRLERYQADDEKLRLKLSKALPIICCKRLACRRFAILQRSTKDFCCASCRTLHRQESRPEEHAKNQRRYRKQFVHARKDRKPRKRHKHAVVRTTGSGTPKEKGTAPLLFRAIYHTSEQS